VLPQMPTKHVAAMILATKPAAAVAILLAMTPDRIEALLDAIPPANLGRILCAAGPRDTPTLIAALSPSQRRAALSTLTAKDVVELLGVVAPGTAWALLADMPPAIAAGIHAELPNELRRRLDRVRPPDLSLDFASAIYLRSAVETIVRTTSRTTWLDERSGDVLAEVFGKLVHIAVRYCPGFALDPRDIVAAAQRANWDDIVGLLVLTNATLSDSASNQAAAIRRTGAPIEVIHWFDAEDDGVFKRSLVRIAG
jgi:MgtE-like protein